MAGINTIFKADGSDITAPSPSNPGLFNLTGKILPGILILGLTGYGLYRIYHFRPLVRDWATANVNQEIQRYEAANRIYRNLYPEFLNEGLFLQYAGKSMSLERQFYPSSHLLERAMFYGADPTIFTTLGKDYTLFSKVDSLKKKRAEFLLHRAKYISPYKYYPRYLLAQYYKYIGKPQKSIDEAEKLLGIVPKKVSPATEEIRDEMQQLIDEKVFQSDEINIQSNKN